MLLLMHLAFAGYFASVTPYRTAGKVVFQRGAKVSDIGAPDERQHVNYILHLVRGEGFPVLDPKDPNLGENYQAHQPPLFYLIASLPARLAPAETFESPKGYWLRFFNCLIGLGTIAGIFALVFWSSKDQNLALLAATFAALLPMHIALNGAISNDPLLFCLCTWSLAFCVLGVQQGFCYGIAIRIGLLAGLAMLTKTTAVALFPILLITSFANYKVHGKKGALGHPLAMFSVVIAIAGFWWMRNVSLYGDPFALKAFNAAFVNSPQASAFISELGGYTYWTQWVGWWTLRSFVGVFGYMDIFLPVQLYGGALLVICICSIIGALRAGRYVENGWISWLTSLFLTVIVLLFVRFNLQFFQGQARYLLPALGPIALLFAIGWQSIFENRARFGQNLLTTIMIALALYVAYFLPGQFQVRTAFGTKSSPVSVNTTVHLVKS